MILLSCYNNGLFWLLLVLYDPDKILLLRVQFPFLLSILGLICLQVVNLRDYFHILNFKTT